MAMWFGEDEPSNEKIEVNIDELHFSFLTLRVKDAYHKWIDKL